MTHMLWTFQVRGGEDFYLHVPGNPPTHHDGVMSVFSLMLTSNQAEEITAFLQGHGCRVLAQPPQEETEDQKAERSALLGRSHEDRVWPTAECPSCFWFDPREDNPCGYAVWEQEVVAQALVSHEAARKGLQKCPLHETPDA